jgi:hypothetical protein
MVMRVLRLPAFLLAGAASGTTEVVFPSSAGFLPFSVELLTAYDIDDIGKIRALYQIKRSFQ